MTDLSPPITPVWLARFYQGEWDRNPVRAALIAAIDEAEAAREAFRYMGDQYKRVELVRTITKPQGPPRGETRWLN